MNLKDAYDYCTMAEGQIQMALSNIMAVRDKLLELMQKEEEGGAEGRSRGGEGGSEGREGVCRVGQQQRRTRGRRRPSQPGR